MKNIFKRLCSLFLIVFIVLVSVCCGEIGWNTEVKITINLPEQIYVEEEVSFKYEVNVVDFELVEIKSSNNDVISITGETLKGLSEGISEISVIILYKDKEYKSSQEVKVIKEKNYELDVILSNELFIGDVLELEVFEKTTASVIDVFSVLSNNESVVKVDGTKISAVGEGSAVIVIAAAFDGVNLSKEVTVVVRDNSKPIFGINLPEKIYASQLFSIEVTYLPDNVKLDEFSIDSSNIDVFEYYPEDLEAQTYEAGEVTLTITATYNGKEYKQDIIINVLEALVLEIDLPNEITTKGVVEFKAYLNPGNIEISEYRIFSTNTKAFTVEKGKVTPVGIGKGMISLSCEYDGATFTASHNLSVVRYYPEEIESNIQEVMFLNETLDVKAFVSPTDNELTTFEVSSSNNEVVAVDGKNIKALSKGDAEITITSGELVKKYQVSVFEFTDIKLEVENKVDLNQVLAYKVIATSANKEIKNYYSKTIQFVNPFS